MRMKRFFRLIFAVTIPTGLLLDFAFASGGNSYIYDVETEISAEPVEVVLVEKPEVLSGPTFNEIVFDHKLSREFLIRYEQVFGRTEQEDHYYMLDRQGYQYTSAGVMSGTQLDSARQEFALYMAKRLIEYHGDAVMKNHPKLRTIYEVKQAISQVNLAVSDSTRFDLSYSFVGNLAHLKVFNSVTNFLVTVSMDPNSYFPTSPKEVIVAQQKTWFDFLRQELALEIKTRLAKFTLIKDLTSALSVNLTHSEYLSPGLTGVDLSKESLSLAGVNFSF